ncbi:MAG: GDSL-type esterase/lipase family protein [Chryseolinea sp.]
MIRFHLTILFLISMLQASAQKLHINGPVKFLALGDSYTYGQSVATSEKWPMQLIKALRAIGLDCDDAKIIATSGWRTDDLINALNEDTPSNSNYNLVSLLIGVNNYYQGGSATKYRTEFEQLLRTAIQFAQGQKQNVLVFSIPDYGYTPFGQSNQGTITQGIDAFNSINEQITSSFGVPYLNITDISRLGLTQSDLVAGDGLHPSGKQYGLWVQRIIDSSVINMGDNAEIPSDTLITVVDFPVQKISVYPNPFVDQLIIENLLVSKIGYSFVITDALGRTVLERQVSEGNDHQSISTQDLQRGLYFYRVIGSSGILTSGKLVK